MIKSERSMEAIRMKERLEAIRERALAQINETDSLDKLNDIRVAFLGKKGELTEVLKGMKEVAPEDRPKVGQIVNETRQAIEEVLDKAKTELAAKKRELQLKSEVIDVTLPSKRDELGHKHPNTLALEEIQKIFIGMGYEVVDGPEVEYDYYNFEALNIPANHPAKDEQDTFYINDKIVLRTQTSPVQARVMEKGKLPIRMISPGRVYRADEVDATHSPCFQQVEGLVIDKGITFADLKGTLAEFAKELFGPDTKVKFRPHHFPFTEPSAEMDVSCFKCGGKGCRFCKGEGMVIDKNITFSDLKGTLTQFVQQLFGKDTKVKFRPHHFPFTEPSAEMDVSCFKCGGKGCRFCKGEGWIEILGCGMVHPRVLRMSGIDPEEYSGFAFGIGQERITLLKYEIDDMRLLYENDDRFLKQF